MPLHIIISHTFQIVLALHLVISVILYENYFFIIPLPFLFFLLGISTVVQICPHFKEKLKWKMKIKIKIWAFIVRCLSHLETNFLARIAFRQLHTDVCCNCSLSFSCSNWLCRQALLLRCQRSLGLLYLNGPIAKWDGIIYDMWKTTLPLLLTYSRVQNTSWIK